MEELLEFMSNYSSSNSLIPNSFNCFSENTFDGASVNRHEAF